MNSFNLDAHLSKIYAAFPEANRQPVIGITANYSDGDATLRDKYYEQVVRAGGTPVLIPPVADKHAIINTLDHIDALLLTGGSDINPLWCGEEPYRSSIRSMLRATSRNCSPCVWPTTGRSLCSASAAAFRSLLWRWEEKCGKI